MPVKKEGGIAHMGPYGQPIWALNHILEFVAVLQVIQIHVPGCGGHFFPFKIDFHWLPFYFCSLCLSVL